MFDVHQQHPRDTSIELAALCKYVHHQITHNSSAILEEDRREIVEYLPSVTDLFAIGGVKLCVVLS